MTNCFVKPNKRPVDWQHIKLIVLDCDGVLTDGRIIYGDNGLDIKHFDAHDGLALMLLKHTDIKVAVITGRSSEALSRRCQDLRIDLLFQGVSRKLECVGKLLADLEMDFDNLVYMGDDWNDILCMRRAALSACPSNALPEIQKIADLVTDNGGGHGAVRELVNHILHKKGIFERAVMSYLEESSCFDTQ
ncbi:MAG: HAD-IIIA family hydrolase [Candidatus Cloacimonetes bacterium]|jgi:3-deoxy-D-manno-octulosonate 8-phosphate phosphatase (KDO 8-P phosphatase)|nr:HAD-IIIA family hydrolase [Candidatus Cloacimonadota bacterium]MDY0336372.1 HAD-IIIA family hydrolase [Candidatus Cloacimonadaceae bacterium]MCK9333829.1 HAD-IIIA family hydrolase [Candidatus Cloacimonadota bacterium]MDD2543223.1 HAD-IIIA family hydrolase [Candidatus Cloacimonadota bacterium]MDD2682863.1 HAD-IIIA family hydrolase [Candidatus Cloacimonadota bacterium]